MVIFTEAVLQTWIGATNAKMYLTKNSLAACHSPVRYREQLLVYAPVIQHGSGPICRESGVSVGRPHSIAGAGFNRRLMNSIRCLKTS